MQEIRAITLPLPYRLGTVNCYLADTGAGFVLIDTGALNKRVEIVNQLAGSGCRPAI